MLEWVADQQTPNKGSCSISTSLWSTLLSAIQISVDIKCQNPEFFWCVLYLLTGHAFTFFSLKNTQILFYPSFTYHSSQHFWHQLCRSFSSHTKQFPGCSIVHFNSDTIYLSLALDPHTKCSLPEDCPLLQMPVSSSRLWLVLLINLLSIGGSHYLLPGLR